MSAPQATPAAPDADALLEVLAGELRRSMGGLRAPATPRPHFLHYALRRRRTLHLRAAHGALLRDEARLSHRLHVDLRVGSPAFDNMLDGGLGIDAAERESAEWLDAPVDLDPTGLRVALWKLTQIKFDEAVRDYLDHRKLAATEYLRDAGECFAPARATVHREPLDERPFPRAAWRDLVRDLSRRFLDTPEIYDPYVEIDAERLQRVMASSEGTRVVTQDVYAELAVGGWILTDDGVYVEATRQVQVRAPEGLPDLAGAERVLEGVLADLGELAGAACPGAYVGPALLLGQAAASLFHEALGHRLEGERLVARGETRTFAGKVGAKILPAGLSVYDDPTTRDAQGLPVWGGYRVDDQGVLAERAELVRDGVLEGYLQSRTPTPHQARSNGHGRHDGVQPVMARMAHLVVEPDPAQARPLPELERELRRRAREAGLRQALVIERIDAGETSTASYDFQVFKGELARVYLVDVETGARTRARDVELVGTPLSALARVVAFSAECAGDAGYCFAESGSVPVSGRAPALLLSELELQQASTSGFHEPLLPPPFADDGSRGRAPGGPRARGRRRRG